MSTSKKTYKDLSIPFFKEVFDIIDEIMVCHKVPYYLIGASAVALQILNEDRHPPRGTKDIDFAIMISSLEEFKEITKSFEEKGFNKVKAPWTFYSEAYNIAIDVLPFGEIEQNDTIQFNERSVDLHMLGFKEVLENPKEVIIEDKIANVPALPGMVVLKLVSWSDRPEERENDLADILKIIETYYHIQWDEIVENHFDTFPEDEELDQLMIAAEVLGREAKVYMVKSKKLSSRINDILDSNLKTASDSAIAKDWAVKLNRDVEYTFSILKAFKRGIR